MRAARSNENDNEIERWVDELMAAGCMPKVAARVVTAVFAAGLQSAPKDKAAEKRRAWDRERKAKKEAIQYPGR